MPLRKIVLLLTALCVIRDLSHALEITADYKRYDKYRDALIAKGNVVVTGKDFRIESPYVIRYFKESKIAAMDKFVFEKDGYRIAGSDLEYYYASVTGNAERIRINFGETYLGARYMTISPEKFELYDAYFTACNSSSSDYHFSARQLALYPASGLIVAHYAICWVMTAPVMPVPTFIYSAPVPKSKFSNKSARLAKTCPDDSMRSSETSKPDQPVPELGANVVDGNFIRQRFNWYFTPRSYAKLLLSYSGKNRLGAGLSANYILNNESEGEIRLGSNEGERFFWGITHYLSFGEKLKCDEGADEPIYDLYRPGGKYSYELEIKESFRERPNLDRNEAPFSRVSFTPLVTFRSNRKPIPVLGSPFTYFWEASHGQVSEEVNVEETPSTEGYTISSPRTNYYADIAYENDLGWFGRFKALFDGSFSDYGQDHGSWDRARQIFLLKQDLFNALSLEYGHVHYMLQRGITPYLFEGYYYSPFDQFIGGLGLKAWNSEFRIRTTHTLPDWDLWNMRYQLLWGLHCYNLIFEYDIRYFNDHHEGTFNFSLELVPSRW